MFSKTPTKIHSWSYWSLGINFCCLSIQFMAYDSRALTTCGNCLLETSHQQGGIWEEHLNFKLMYMKDFELIYYLWSWTIIIHTLYNSLIVQSLRITDFISISLKFNMFSLKLELKSIVYVIFLDFNTLYVVFFEKW